MPAGTYYIVSEGSGSNTGNIATIAIFNVDLPPVTTYNTKNFVRTWDIVKPVTDHASISSSSDLQDVQIATAYLDGLGRTEQNVLKKGSLFSAGNFDVVTPFEYDQFGREIKKYLPYAASTSDGSFKTNPLSDQTGFYNGANSPVYGQSESYFYNKTDFEPSPLNRLTKSLAPGTSWIGTNRGIEQKYWTNTSTDDVKIWTVTNSSTFGNFGSYSTSSSYPAGTLIKSATIDEHGKQVIEFKDKEGNVLLKKIQFTASADDGINGKNYDGWICTYYIYDDFNRLRCVIQPRGVELVIGNAWNINSLSGDILNEQCFRYEYDQRGRMISKKVYPAPEKYIWCMIDGIDPCSHKMRISGREITGFIQSTIILTRLL